jgi:potassium efflux system protein
MGVPVHRHIAQSRLQYRPTGLRPAALVAAIACALAIALSSPLAAQIGPPPPRTEVPLGAPDPDPARSSIQEQLGQVRDAADLSDDERQKLVSAYEAALEELDRAGSFRTQAEGFEQSRTEAPRQLESLRADLAEPVPEVKIDVPSDAGVAEIAQHAATAEAALQAARDKVAELEAEPRHRADRRTEVPRRLAEAEQELATVREDLAAQDPGSLSEQGRADRALLEARAERLEQEAAALRSEMASYEARRDLLTARTDMAARELRRAEQEAEQWREALAEARHREATDMVRRTDREAGDVVAEAIPVAEQNQALAARFGGPRGLTARLRAAGADLRAAMADLEKWTADFARVSTRVDSAGVTKAIGALLRKKLLDLPDAREYRQDMRRSQDEVAEAQLDLIEWEEERAALSDMEAAVDRKLAELPPPPAGSAREQAERDVRRLLQTRRDLLDLLIRDQNGLFSTLIEIDARRGQLVELIREYRHYIEEKVLWFRSSPALSPSALKPAARSVRELLLPSAWLSAGRSLLRDARDVPLLYLAVVAIVLWVTMKRRLRKRLGEVGDLVRSPETDSFRLTLEALFLTAAAALPGPVLVWFVGWRMAAPLSAPAFAKTVGSALQSILPLYVTMAALRQICRRDGLADAHFRWPEQSTRMVRGHLGWLTPTVLPAAFAYYACAWDEATDQALAALAFAAVLASISVFLWWVLHPTRGVTASVIARHPGGWTDRLRFVWHTTFAGLPLALAVATLAGYQYTARVLAERFLATVWLALALLLFYSLLLRWLFVARRRLALERMRRRREAAEGGEDSEAEPAVPAEPEVSLRTISEQMRSLVANLSAVLLVIGLYLVWRDVLPALGFFSAWPVWQNVTLGNLGSALIVVVITYVAARNIPGLLEITILQRLPLESGLRFAIAAISRYIISVIGIVVAFQAMGIGWDKVQWLAAAVTVGLGFGLQEIFANFVSGLIVLLERPMRVGDTVTVGETTGTVTRIRMRATTITDWDRKELVVPNKEFVTGRLINWTLSDRVLRLVVPVGVAYGSDTDRTRDLLLKVASEHRHVLEDPPPTALFMGFGDSSLDFELRVFLPSVDVRLETGSELHFGIDRAFREAGIEIAFPQRDVHVRSIKAPVRLESSEGGGDTAQGE